MCLRAEPILCESEFRLTSLVPRSLNAQCGLPWPSHPWMYCSQFRMIDFETECSLFLPVLPTVRALFVPSTGKTPCNPERVFERLKLATRLELTPSHFCSSCVLPCMRRAPAPLAGSGRDAHTTPAGANMHRRGSLNCIPAASTLNTFAARHEFGSHGSGSLFLSRAASEPSMRGSGLSSAACAAGVTSQPILTYVVRLQAESVLNS